MQFASRRRREHSRRWCQTPTRSVRPGSRTWHSMVLVSSVSRRRSRDVGVLVLTRFAISFCWMTCASHSFISTLAPVLSPTSGLSRRCSLCRASSGHLFSNLKLLLLVPTRCRKHRVSHSIHSTLKIGSASAGIRTLECRADSGVHRGVPEAPRHSRPVRKGGQHKRGRLHGRRAARRAAVPHQPG